MSERVQEWALRVYWEDTDAGGVVFYANYLKFLERARTEWLRGLGFSQQELKATTGGMFVVGFSEMHYLTPARLDDTLTVRTILVQLGQASAVLRQSIWKQAATGESEVCSGTVRIAWVDAASFKPARMPQAVHLQLKIFESPA